MHGQHLQHSNSIDFRASDPKLHSGFVLFPAVDPLEVGATCMQTAVEMVRSSTKRLEMLATKAFSCFFCLSNIEQHVCKCWTEWNRILIYTDHARSCWWALTILTNWDKRHFFHIFSVPPQQLTVPQTTVSETPRHQLTNSTLDNRSISCQASLAVAAHTQKCRWAVPRAAKLPKHLARAASEVV